MLLIVFIDDKRLTVQQNFKGFCENNWSLGFSKKVYLVGNNVVKNFVEGGLEASLYGLGTEVLDCYSVFIPSSGQT
jgi:hypothetical protein